MTFLHLSLMCALLVAATIQPALAEAPCSRSSDFRYQYGAAIHSAETSLAIAWTQTAQATRQVGEVYQWMEHPIGVAPSWSNVRAAARRIGYVDRWRSLAATDDAEALLLKDLQTSAVLLRVDQPNGLSAPATASKRGREHWILALPHPDTDAICCLDPTRVAPGRVTFTPRQLLDRCAAAERQQPPRRVNETPYRYAWLPLIQPLRTAAAPKLTPHSRYEYARKMASMNRRIAATLVDEEPDSPEVEDFTVVAEEPFVVAGDVTAKQMARWSQGTIRWAVRKMKEKYFQKNPDQVLEVWLFNGKESYERNVTRLFGRKPTTPYGYYSPRHGALVMNIRTGGGTLVHEILHPFMESNFPACPSWFNEGLASLYEQSAEHDGQIWGKTNWRLAGLQRAISNRGLPTFEDLCKTTTTEFYEDAAGVHYAQARYLCYYLQENGKLADYYREFRKNATRDPSGYATLTKVLGEEDMAAFQTDWQRYVMKLRFP